MSNDKQFTIVSTFDNLILYGGVTEGKFNELQKFPLSFSEYHQISKNGEYLIAGEEDGIKIFKFNCL